ncbi:MAG TPA: dihydrolipoyl dehydrogenase [Candidatus Atribacteria bacterium]|nr:dihydrolipoyl dehydrogenase [Candidatus Atribacteria bacterium]
MMKQDFDYDLLVLGGGPGGYVAAIRASRLGLKTAVIERDKLGGVCLNVGCIPSKSLIHQAKMFDSLGELESLGVTVDRKGLDHKKVYSKSRKAADTLSRGVSYLMKKNGIDVIQAEGVITGKNEISLSTGRKVTGRFIIIATGSRPKVIPGFEFDEKYVLSSTGALMLDKLPEKMLILGAGAIGVEFAYIMNSFGVEVVLVELMDRILPLEDEEISSLLARSFTKAGIKVMTGAKALSVSVEGDKARVELEDNKGTRSAVTVDKVLVAVGRTPNTDGIGLENIGIATEKGYIPVGDYYRTSVEGIYAIGDVVNTPLLAHVASKEGEIAAEDIAGISTQKRIDPLSIPGAVYCEPQVASFGLSEWRAKKEGVPYEKASFPYRGAGKSVAVGQPDGFVKVLYDPRTKELLGAHIIGADATEIIHELLLIRAAELLPEDVASMVHAHPTISEVVMEVMRAVEGKAVHV